MAVWQALILGLVQGLTEFLPVSSSGHLVFFQALLGMDMGDLALFFDVVLHLGTLVAVCVVFWKDIVSLFRRPFKPLVMLIVVSIPAAVVGVLFDDWIDELFFGGALLGCCFMITAVILFCTEQCAKNYKVTLPLCYKVTVPMGFAQVVALLPGISRSGSTIAAGTFAGGNRDDVARFSFLMSIPMILGSFLVSLVGGLSGGEIQESVSEGGWQFGWCLIVGFVAAVVAGLLAIKLMMRVIRNANYKWFSLYLMLLGIACLILDGYGFFV